MHKHFVKNPQWIEVLKTASILKQKGFESFVVGGCVRDFFLQREPKDFDMVTNAKIEDLIHIFPKAITVGAQFGVLILAYKEFQIEISSFRKDGVYKDGRRPSNVSAGSVEDDAARRDFTVNALFYNLQTEEFLDFYQGEQDIKAGIIKTVGKASLRFQEDHLRMLRAVRFCVELNFTIENGVKEAIIKQPALLKKTSSERIGEEFKKILAADFLKGVKLLKELKLLPFVSSNLFSFVNKNKLVNLGNLEYGSSQKPLSFLRPCLLILSLMLTQKEINSSYKEAVSFVEDLKKLKFTKVEIQFLTQLVEALHLLVSFPLKPFIRKNKLAGNSKDLIQALLKAETFKSVRAELALHYKFAQLITPSPYLAELEELVKALLTSDAIYPESFVSNLKVYIQVINLIKKNKIQIPKWSSDYAGVAIYNRSNFLKLMYSANNLLLIKASLRREI